MRQVLCEWPLRATLCSELETRASGALAAELGASEAAGISVDQGAGSALLGLESEAAWAALLFASGPVAGASVFLAWPPSWGARWAASVPLELASPALGASPRVAGPGAAAASCSGTGGDLG